MKATRAMIAPAKEKRRARRGVLWRSYLVEATEVVRTPVHLEIRAQSEREAIRAVVDSPHHAFLFRSGQSFAPELEFDDDLVRVWARDDAHDNEKSLRRARRKLKARGGTR